MGNRERKKKNRILSDWAGRHPFEPSKKKPFLIGKETSIPRVYGRPPHQIPTCLHVSTDKITCTEFSISPGEYFDPPDIHTGDEVYYMLKGTGTVLNPETGEVWTVNEGDMFYIPKGAWHQTFNFTDKKITILCSFAPEIWSGGDSGAPAVFKGKPVFYKGENP